MHSSKLHYQNKFCQSLQIAWNQAFRQQIERQKVRKCVFHRNFLKYNLNHRSKLDWNWLVFMAECPGAELAYGQHWSVFSHVVCLQHWCCGNHPWTVSERISAKPKKKKMFNRRSFLLGNPCLIVICRCVKKVIQRLMFYGDGLIIIRLLLNTMGLAYIYNWNWNPINKITLLTALQAMPSLLLR